MMLFIKALLYMCTGTALSAFTSTQNPEANSYTENTQTASTELRNTNNTMLETTTKERGAGSSTNSNVYLGTISSSRERPLPISSQPYSSGKTKFGIRTDRYPTVIGVTAIQLRNLEDSRRGAKETTANALENIPINHKSITKKYLRTCEKGFIGRTGIPKATIFGVFRRRISSPINNLGLHSITKIFSPNNRSGIQDMVNNLQNGWERSTLINNPERIDNFVKNIGKIKLQNLKTFKRVRRAGINKNVHSEKIGEVTSNNKYIKREFKIPEELYRITNRELEEQNEPKAIILSGKLLNTHHSNEGYVKEVLSPSPKVHNNQKLISTTVRASYIVHGQPQNIHYLANNAGKARAPPIRFNVDLYTNNAQKGNRLRSGRLDSSALLIPQNKPTVRPYKIGRPRTLPKLTPGEKPLPEKDIPIYRESDEVWNKEKEMFTWLKSLPIPEEGETYSSFPIFMNYGQSFKNTYPDTQLMSLQSGYKSTTYPYNPICYHHGIGLTQSTNSRQKMRSINTQFPYFKGCCRGSSSGNRNVNRWSPFLLNSPTSWPVNYYHWIS